MARLHAYLSYRDAPAALVWLQAVGFEIVRRQDGNEGAVLHSEVRMGDAVLMVASADADYDRPRLLGQSTGYGVYLLFDDPAEVDEWHDRAVRAGGRSVIPPEDTEWGSRRARVLDLEGGEWSAGTYEPGLSW